MSTHDYVIANATGAAVRADINSALAAIVSNNSSTTAPGTTYSYMFWADLTSGYLKQRNAANTAWVTLFSLSTGQPTGLNGLTSSIAELNILDGVTATYAEINVLDGITSTTAELNILHGVTATAAELNKMDGVIVTPTEINYLSGATSNLQSQINGLTTITGALLDIQVFTASGTWNKPAGTNKVEIWALGGGGGGGGCQASYKVGGGGQGGSTVYKLLTSGFGVSETITIGAGGSGGTSSGTSGSIGGNTSFGSLVVAGGGQGGYGSTSMAATGGGYRALGGASASASSGYDLLFLGQSNSSYIVGTSHLIRGGYGANYFSPIGDCFYSTYSWVGGVSGGTPSNYYGMGGTGSTVSNYGVGVIGGNGTAGLIIVKSYS